MENTRKFTFNLEAIAWGALFILWGFTELFPSLPKGTGAILSPSSRARSIRPAERLRRCMITLARISPTFEERHPAMGLRLPISGLTSLVRTSSWQPCTTPMMLADRSPNM